MDIFLEKPKPTIFLTDEDLKFRIEGPVCCVVCMSGGPLACAACGRPMLEAKRKKGKSK